METESPWSASFSSRVNRRLVIAVVTATETLLHIVPRAAIIAATGFLDTAGQGSITFHPMRCAADLNASFLILPSDQWG